MRSRMPKRVSSQAGFSLVEMITVMAIIMIMAAVIIPPLANYVRLYRIRAATNQVGGSISAARMRAISKNANLGVTFAVIGNDSYRVVIEDDQNPQTAPNWLTIGAENWGTVLTIPAQVGPLERLPQGIIFVSPADCPIPTGGVAATAADTWGLRFGRLGAGCGVTSTGCGGTPAGVPAYTNYVDVAGTGLATVCVCQTNTTPPPANCPANSMRRWVNVSSGGRVVTQP
jgi:prepilin-type N-terminal cleavage/methylation domain-containing protein